MAKQQKTTATPATPAAGAPAFVRIRLKRATTCHLASDGMLALAKAGEIMEATPVDAQHLLELGFAELVPDEA